MCVSNELLNYSITERSKKYLSVIMILVAYEPHGRDPLNDVNHVSHGNPTFR